MRRQTLAILLSVLAVITTGFVGLVIEDLFPAGGSFKADGPTQARVWAGAFFLLLLVYVTWRISRGSGTLYYLRILNERAPDIHHPARTRAKTRYLDYRSVTRSLSLGSGGWVDVADIVESARSELQSAASTDNEWTSTEFAPNAHWPIQFALGFDWPLTDQTKIMEFKEGKNRPVFHDRAFIAPVVLSQVQEVGRKEPDCTVELVHVHVHLSDGDVLKPEHHPDNIRDVFDRTADRTFLWGALSSSQSRTHVGPVAAASQLPVDVHPNGPITPHAAAEGLAQAILTALDAHPYAVVAVSAQVPKTVAVLAGRYFAAYLQWRSTPKPKDAEEGSPEMAAWLELSELERACQKQYKSWNDAWSRLVLLSYNESTRRMQAMRVRDAQPVRLPDLPAADRGLRGQVDVRTPHSLAVFGDAENPLFTHDPDGAPARLSEDRLPAKGLSIGGAEIPLIDLSYSDTVTDLPSARDGVWVVVSRVTAQAVPHRDDLVFPLDEVRDSENRIIGCRALGRFRPSGSTS